MALKSVDDKFKRLVLLEELQRSPALDLSQKKWLREELMRTRRGIQGERESVHCLDHYLKDAENNVLLHDLRFVIDGEVTSQCFPNPSDLANLLNYSSKFVCLFV